MSSTDVHHSFAAMFLSKTQIQAANRLVLRLFAVVTYVADSLQVSFPDLDKFLSLLEKLTTVEIAFLHFLYIV